MMKIKIFYGWPGEVEKETNDWLAENDSLVWRQQPALSVWPDGSVCVMLVHSDGK